MSVHYFDPSVWIKRHFQEIGSDAVNALFRAGVEAACCRLGVLEMVATVAGKGHGESLEPAVIQLLLDNVNADFAAFRVVPVDEGLIVAAMNLARRHRLRAMDAIHLACALSLQPAEEVIMVSSDLELLAAATNEGLGTLNPAAPGA
jgi:predicted nucleic acid-binding protein